LPPVPVPTQPPRFAVFTIAILQIPTKKKTVSSLYMCVCMVFDCSAECCVLFECVLSSLVAGQRLLPFPDRPHTGSCLCTYRHHTSRN
jgi:hypothetical protein